MMQPRDNSASHRALAWGAARAVVLVLGAVAVVAAAVHYYRHDPSRQRGLFPPCMFHRLTRLHCPGCGSQRAVHQLLHGRVLSALRCNALMCLAIPAVAWELCSRLTRRLPTLLDRPRVGWAVVWLVCLFWVARNIPVWPCSGLAPS